MNKNLPKILNWINGEYCDSLSQSHFVKFNPSNGLEQSLVTSSSKEDVVLAVNAADEAFKNWATMTPVARGAILSKIASKMRYCAVDLAGTIHLEVGKSMSDAMGEVNSSIMQAEFFAGEGMRLYGKSLTSGIPNKYSHTVRSPLGVAGLIVPANTPLANIAWKLFPALICGNTVVLKSSEDAPLIAKKWQKFQWSLVFHVEFLM